MTEEEYTKLYNIHLEKITINNSLMHRADSINELSKFLFGSSKSYKNWKQYYKIRLMLDFYYSAIEQRDEKIDKIVVFENPPESGHFLLNGGNYFNVLTEDVIDIQIFDSRNKKIIALFKKHFNPIKTKTLGLDFYQKNGIHLTKFAKEFILRIESLLNNNIIFIDLFSLPKKPNELKKIREKWKIIDSYYFNDKRITVLSFILAFKYLSEKNLKFNTNCKIAIGTPPNTSVSIFEYYSDKLFKLDEEINFDLSKLNCPMTFMKTNKVGTTFPLYKSNIIGSSNFPERVLVKNVFDILD